MLSPDKIIAASNAEYRHNARDTENEEWCFQPPLHIILFH